MAYDFKYIRTGTGELSGPSMIWQTEQALTQIGTYADEANTKADEALETANTALNKANEAAEAAERAQNTADAAQAAASHAQDTADAAQSAAGDAQNTANEALEAAQKGVADAAKAQTAADKAQASADAAQTAADTAQLTADSAQNAADKAQGTADAAQKTATIALDTANNSQSSANVAQDTADNALLVSQSTQQAFYEHAREYTTQIAQALGEFEADSTTVDFDNFTNPIKLYITSPDASITISDGQVNAPFYLWNFTTDDRSSTAQFVYAANGLEYSRYGTIGQDSLIPGTDTYTLENNSKNATLTCTGVASGMSIAKSGTLANTWTASATRPSYILGTWVITGIANGTINLNGVTIATLSDTGFYPTGQRQLQEDNTSFVIENMTYSATDGLTITAAVQWLNFDSQITWGGWKAGSGSGGTVATDGVTIRYNSASNLQAKDIAINGDESDLASARSLTAKFIKGLGSVDCNTIAENMIASVYQAGTTNGPGFASVLLSFFSSAAMGAQAAFISNSPAIVRASLRSKSANGYSPWSDFLMSGRVGDGIKVNNGIPSVPEYEGATASSAGTSGLVPPAAAGQQESFLTGGGEYKPALSTGGGFMTGSIQINDPANDIAVAPPANTERGLFLGDKNSVVMGGFDIIQRASDNAKYTQFYSKNSSGHITSLAAVTYEDGTRELVADSPLQINDIQIKQVVDGGRRVIVLSGARGKEGYSFRFSPDTGEAYMDGRVIHAKADTAGYADRAQVAGSAETLFVTGWGNTKWGSTPYGQSPLYVWCLPSGGSDMMPCSPGVLSVGAANFCTYTPNVRVGTDGSVLPAGGTWRIMTSRNGDGAIRDMAGGSVVRTAGGVFMAIRVA